MKQKRQEEAEELNLPRLYRWFLKIPNLPDYFDRLGRIPLFVGALVYSLTLCGIYFVAILPVPIMIATYFLVGFPLNVVIGLSIPAIITIFWARAQMENGLALWRSIQTRPKQRDIEEKVKEYMELVEKQRRKRKKQAD